MKRNALLDLGDGLRLPVDAVTETFSLLGQKGAGKTHTSSVLIEELLEQRQRVAIVDPLGVWWGLRSSSDGKSEGYPVIIFGGDHADLPIEPSAGELIANIVIDQHIACVIDLSHMRKAEQRTFMTAFTETLYHRNREPMHLVVDEADLYAGQRPPKGAERLLGAMEDLVRRGRSRGIGMTLISQRPAVLHKDVLSQTSVLITLRLISPQDIKALEAWIGDHDAKGQRREFIESLPSLPVGTAWFWSPGAFDIFRQVRVRARRTFDSSSTPRVGQRREMPKEYARIDIGALQEQMSDLVERQRDADPRTLRRKVAQLEAELTRARAVKATAPATVEVERVVEVPVLGEGDAAQLAQTAASLVQVSEQLATIAATITTALDATSAAGTTTTVAPPVRPAQPKPRATAPSSPRAPARRTATPVAPPASGDAQGTYDALRAGAKRILEALAQFYPNPLTKAQVGALASMRHKSGTFSTYVGELKRAGFIDETPDKSLGASELGIAVVGVVPAAPTTKDEVYALWQGRLRAGAMRMLDAVLAADPAPTTKERVADAAELSAASGTFSTYLGELRRFGLVRVQGQQLSLGEVWEMLP